MQIKITLITVFLIIIRVSSAQVQDSDTSSSRLIDRLDLTVFGSVLYHNFNWETDSSRKNNVDLNQVVFAPEFEINDKLELEMEIEFEHGGTGATMEYESYEEFGEFEQEVEHGGEVIIEELELSWHIKPWLELKGGKIKVPVGLENMYYKPADYLTSTFNNVEETFLPLGWYETGIGAEGDLGQNKKFTYQAVVVTGLDNSAFSASNWIKYGSHQRFEYTNAESFAFAGRFDYNLNDKSTVGISGYTTNSTPNRPKSDLTADGWVSIADVHAHVELKQLYLQVYGLYGTLQNAFLINDANATLSNDLGVSRTPAGSAVLGSYAEAGYDIMPWISKNENSALYLFAGYYYYDSQFKTSGEDFNNPKYERTEIRGGLNYQWKKSVGIKADYTNRQLNIEGENTENTFTIAMTFQI